MSYITLTAWRLPFTRTACQVDPLRRLRLCLLIAHPSCPSWSMVCAASAARACVARADACPMPVRQSILDRPVAGIEFLSLDGRPSFHSAAKQFLLKRTVLTLTGVTYIGVPASCSRVVSGVIGPGCRIRRAGSTARPPVAGRDSFRIGRKLKGVEAMTTLMKYLTRPSSCWRLSCSERRVRQSPTCSIRASGLRARSLKTPTDRRRTATATEYRTKWMLVRSTRQTSASCAWQREKQ